jgi:hypothetical protein
MILEDWTYEIEALKMGLLVKELNLILEAWVWIQFLSLTLHL